MTDYIKGWCPIRKQEVRFHVLKVEKAWGRFLPKGAVVHHVDENPLNNVNSNLVLCPDQAYHKLLHTRMDALKACGNANWRKCSICKKYDAPERMRKHVYWASYIHDECNNKQRRERRNKNA